MGKDIYWQLFEREITWPKFQTPCVSFQNLSGHPNIQIMLNYMDSYNAGSHGNELL